MRPISLNANQLKLIAIIAMVIDHIGAVFYPDLAVLRGIGRLTMPIMAYFIAEGYRHTHDVKRYMLRLLIFGLIAAYPYTLYFGEGPFNIMFSLLFGLIAITLYDRSTTPISRSMSLFMPMLIATVFGFDGEFIVVFLVYIFHSTHGNLRKSALSMMMLYIIIEVLLLTSSPRIEGFHLWIQLFALLDLPLLACYDGTLGKPRLPRYTFYIFYPLHITILLALKLLIF